MSLPPTTPPFIAIVKVDDFLSENASGSGAGPCPAKRNADEQLQTSIESLYVVYHVSFQRLLEGVEQSCQDSSKCLHAVISSPLKMFIRLPSSQIRHMIG